jgi:hypothetical protein
MSRRLPSFNTDHSSPERQWVKVKVDTLWFDPNELPDCDKIIEWAEKTKKKAAKEGIEHATVAPYNSTDEWDNIRSSYFECSGWRKETDAEYKKRLTSLIAREKNEKYMFDLKKNYFELRTDLLGTAHEQRINAWELAKTKMK